MSESLGRRAQQFAIDNIATFARGGYLRTELGDLLEAFARQEASRPQPDTHRTWTISQGRWPEPAWSATGPNFDASYEGEEDGWVGNGESAHAATREALITEIDEWFAEHGEAA